MMAALLKDRWTALLFIGLGLLLLLIPISARSSPPLAGWKSIIVAAQNYSLQAPLSAKVTLYSPEDILHVELPGPLVLTVQRLPNPEKLPSGAWTERYIADPTLKETSELAPAVPISDREPLTIDGLPAVSFTIYGPVRPNRRTVLAVDDQVYLIDRPVGEGQQEPLFDQIVATFEVGKFAFSQGFSSFDSLQSEDIPTLEVPYYSQRDPAWICDQIGTCWCYLGACYGYTGIGDAGCYIASEAMIFDYFTGGQYMDPQELDTCLTQNGGYTYWAGCGYGLCATSYQPLPACSPSYVDYNSYSSDRSILDEDLRDGYPVIAWVDGGAHYLVIIGKQNGLYQVNDPLYPRTEIYSGQIIHFVRFQGPLNHNPTPDQRFQPGFPVQAYNTTEPISGVPFLHTLVANLDADPSLEIALSALHNGPLYTWNADSSLASNESTGFHFGAASPAAGRIARESAGLGLVTAYSNGKLVASGESGAPMAGWPYELNLGGGPPALADIDGDGVEEIFAADATGFMYAFRSDGRHLSGWPVPSSNGAAFAPAAIADLDGDQDLEIVAVTVPQNGSVALHGFHHNGSPVANFPIQFPGNYLAVPVIGDVDNDSSPEIMVTGSPAVLMVYSSNGILERTLQPQGSLSYPTAPALADIDGDQVPEIILQADRSLNVWHGDGTALPGWPENWSSDYLPGYSSPVVGDVDGDSHPDILITLQHNDDSGLGQVRIFDRYAEILSGFPQELPLGPSSIPAIADIDLDGRNEVIVTSSGPGASSGFHDKVWVYDLAGETHGPVEWGQFGGGPAHRGVYPVPSPPAPQFPALEADFYSYLPLVDTRITQPTGRIFGQVQFAGEGIGNIPVTLRHFDGTHWRDLISLASDGRGEYRFVGLNALPPGEKYEISFTNSGENPQLVKSWTSREIQTFPPGAHVAISSVDLSSPSLTSPGPGETISLPAQFQWQPRSASSADLYTFVVYDPDDLDPFYQSDPFRDGPSFSMTSLPARFEPNRNYVWSVWVWGPDGSLAIPGEVRSVKFSTP